MGIFVQDTFTGGAGLLTSHVGEIGGWSDTSGSTWGFPQNSTSYAKLDGAGSVYATADDTRRAAIQSDVLSPQMDVYLEMQINVGASINALSLKNYLHNSSTLHGWSGDGGHIIFNDSSSTSLYAPYYATGTFETVLPGAAPNDVVTCRFEYDFTHGAIRAYWNGGLVATWGIYTGNQPIEAGVFAMDMDSFSATTGNGLKINYLEIGTIDPPTAFWTDLTGSLVETIGA